MSATTTSLERARTPFAARAVLAPLERLAQGRLRVELPNGSTRDFGPGGPTASLAVRDWRAFGRTIRDGDIGFAEGFLEGEWTSSDLPQLLRLLAANRDVLGASLHGNVIGRIVHRMLHALRANTRQGSKRNIAAHYDLGNAFYALWLDRSMTYSSALFGDGAAATLEGAQRAKHARALRRLALPSGAHVLEIGCGWGAFAELAAQAGLRVTGLTLSREQLDYARERIQRAGLAPRARFEFRDYRDVRERYDAVVSIEMIEAVGERYWPNYFERVAAAMSTDGRALVQTIVIDDTLFADYRSGTDFIREHVFPGGMLPSPARFEAEARRAGLEPIEALRFGADYARTLAEWRTRFLDALPEVRALGFDERFVRLWEFYLAYCEAGFVSGSTDVIQYLMVKR